MNPSQFTFARWSTALTRYWQHHESLLSAIPHPRKLKTNVYVTSAIMTVFPDIMTHKWKHGGELHRERAWNSHNSVKLIICVFSAYPVASIPTLNWNIKRLLMQHVAYLNHIAEISATCRDNTNRLSLWYFRHISTAIKHPHGLLQPAS